MYLKKSCTLAEILCVCVRGNEIITTHYFNERWFCKYLYSSLTKGKSFVYFIFCFSVCHEPNPYASVTPSSHWSYWKLKILDSLCFRVKEFSETSQLFLFSCIEVAVSFNRLLPESTDLVIEQVVNRRALQVHTAPTPSQHSSESSKMCD